MLSGGLGLPELAIFLSFFFWVYLFGVVGGLLTVPLTLFARLLLEANPGARWLAVLMADSGPAGPDPAPAAPMAVTTSALDQ